MNTENTNDIMQMLDDLRHEDLQDVHKDIIQMLDNLRTEADSYLRLGDIEELNDLLSVLEYSLGDS